jgi:hypothetical protein
MSKTGDGRYRKMIRGREKGFAASKLVLILVITCAVVGFGVPTMNRTMKAAKSAAARAELATVQSAMMNMMVDQGMSRLPSRGPWLCGDLRSTPEQATVAMSEFPYNDECPLRLMGGPAGDYIQGDTKWTYYIASDGTVMQGPQPGDQPVEQ